MSSGSPSKIYNILPNLTVEDYGTSMYHCSYKNNTIEYTNIKITDNKAHSIYENFNKIKYEIYKYWFFNRENINSENRRTELLLELLEYLTHKDFFTMEHVDKVLLSIIHQELMKMHL
jgi:hypothetical protein